MPKRMRAIMLHAMSRECKKVTRCEIAACSEKTNHMTGVFGVVMVSYKLLH